MTKTYHYSIIIVLATIVLPTACTDSGDDFSHDSLYSSWERVHYHEDHETSTLEYREGGSKMAIFTPCNDILSSFCVPTQIFTRVN